MGPCPCKSRDLDTEQTQRDDNLKTREELTPTVKELRATGGWEELEPDWPPLASRSTSLLTPDWAPGLRLGQQSLLSSDPRAANSGGSGVMPSSWTVEEGFVPTPATREDPHICTSPCREPRQPWGSWELHQQGAEAPLGGAPQQHPTVASYCTGPWLR